VIRGRLVALAAAVLLVAACSGGGDGAADTTSAPSSSTTAAPETTLPPETTQAETTTTEVTGPVYPLTGLPVTDPEAAARPALVVKIDNNRLARPQNGLNEADIVFEEIVEVQTRFAIVLHSQGADPVGPIRSGRTQDIDLLGSFNAPLFAWSGGNRNVTRAIENSDLVSLSAQKNSVYQGGGFFRSSDRKGPHDLYAQSSMLWTLAPEGAGPPPPQFQYGDESAVAAQGEPASGATGDMDGLSIGWVLDEATGQYARSSAGEPHLDAISGGQVTTDNLIVMTVVYRPSPADRRSPEAQTIGSGEAMVFTGGRMVAGTWTRADRLSPIVLTDAEGAPILLTPGRTFVELARAGTFTPVP
jgi:hypothetical protein